jgi:hypothetical protein
LKLTSAVSVFRKRKAVLMLADGIETNQPSLAAAAELKALGRHGSTAQAGIQQPIALPGGIDAGRPLRDLPVRLVPKGGEVA